MRHKISAALMNPIALALFAMFCLLPAFGQDKNFAASTETSREAFRLLKDIKTQAAELRRDSSYLESFTHSPGLSWQSHFGQLADMGFRLNRIGQDFKTLERIRPGVSPQQQEALDRVLAVAQELASDTNTAIEYLNQNQDRLQSLQYRNDIKSSADAATKLATVMNIFVEPGKRSRL